MQRRNEHSERTIQNGTSGTNFGRVAVINYAKFDNFGLCSAQSMAKPQLYFLERAGAQSHSQFFPTVVYMTLAYAFAMFNA